MVLADEPTAALDWHSGRNVLMILSALAHEQKRAVVVVTHDHRVLEFADRFVRMEDGRIVPETKDTKHEGSAPWVPGMTGPQPSVRDVLSRGYSF